MTVSDLLNADVKPTDVQASLTCSSVDMRCEFQKWLTDGNARKYSPEVFLSCMDKASDYASRKKIAAFSLWEYTHPNAFSPVYKRLIEAKLLRITDNKTHKMFITAGQLYLRFLKEKPYKKETSEVNNVVTVPSTELAIKKLFSKKIDWSLFNYGFAVPQSSVSVFFEAIGTELNSRNAKAKIALEFNGKLYQANAAVYGKAIQVRWQVNDDIAIDLRTTFSKCYEQMKEIKFRGTSNLLPDNSIFLDVIATSVCGQLELVESTKPRTESILSKQTDETFLGNNELPQITSPQSKTNCKDVIAWLVTQPNTNGTLYLENVVQQYMYALFSAPMKLQLSETDNRDVFACRSVSELNILWNTFKTASNYKQVNTGTSGAFSAGMRCLSRYLEHLSNENRYEQQPNQEDSPSIKNKTLLSGSFQDELSPSVVDELTRILTEHFSNGFRIGSPIEMVRLRSFAAANLGRELTLSDEELKAHVTACGTTYEGKVYAVSAEVKEQIKELATDYFTDGAQVIFFAEFYAKNENWLFRASVVSEDMLIGILRRLFPKLSFTQTYFGYTDASVFATLESEILRVWGDDVLLTYAQLAGRLQYIPLDRIKYALGQNGDFIWSSVETFSHISRIEIIDEERGAIRAVAARECNARGYASITDLPYNEIEERNYELSITAVHNAVYRICLSDKFDKKGKIVTRKGDVFDAITIMKEYCRTIDKCSLDDLLNYEKELIGEVHRWIPMEAGNTVLVRIDKETYVADRYVHFNAELIDEAIELVVEGDYLPLKSFTTFGAFPDCGQTWNLFLLESYCRRFSRKFRFDTLSVNSRNAGTVIRKSCGMVYTEIMTDAVANADVPLKDAAVGRFLFDSGYTGRSANAKVAEIIDKARAIRERRD